MEFYKLKLANDLIKNHDMDHNWIEDVEIFMIQQICLENLQIIDKCQ